MCVPIRPSERLLMPGQLCQAEIRRRPSLDVRLESWRRRKAKGNNKIIDKIRLVMGLGSEKWLMGCVTAKSLLV